MPTERLASKLYIPLLRPNLVPRPRLIQRLIDGLQTKPGLAPISAPVSFGKTTLVVAWLSLDEADNSHLDYEANRKHKWTPQLNPNQAN